MTACICTKLRYRYSTLSGGISDYRSDTDVLYALFAIRYCVADFVYYLLNVRHFVCIMSGGSFMKMTNNKGPNILPCGTPEVTGAHCDATPSNDDSL